MWSKFCTNGQKKEGVVHQCIRSADGNCMCISIVKLEWSGVDVDVDVNNIDLYLIDENFLFHSLVSFLYGVSCVD